MNKASLGFNKRIKSCTVDYFDLTGSSFFVNSEGTCIEQDKLYVWARITASACRMRACSRLAAKKSALQQATSSSTQQAPETLGEKVAKLAVEQLTAKSPKGGKFPVVLGPNVVGVFVHEAFGHLAEADLALSGGVLANNLGKKIGSDLVTFYDDGTIHGAFGAFKYDDEGVASPQNIAH